MIAVLNRKGAKNAKKMSVKLSAPSQVFFC